MSASRGLRDRLNIFAGVHFEPCLLPKIVCFEGNLSLHHYFHIQFPLSISGFIFSSVPVSKLIIYSGCLLANASSHC